MNIKKIGVILIFITILAIIIWATYAVNPNDIDVYDFLYYMTELVRYINHSLVSAQDIEKTDFIYFLFYLAEKDNKTQCETIEYIDTQRSPDSFGYGLTEKSEQHTVGIDILAEYMDVYFGIGEEYFDKYKNGSYKYRSPHDFYDAETDMFKFITIDSYSYALTSDYSISRDNTKIFINGNKIIIKTMYLYDYYNNDLRYSADYKFKVHKKDKKIYYQLESVDIYDDDRNKNTDVVLTFDGTDYTAPWFIVERNGKTEYYTLYPFIPADINSWSWVNPYGTGILWFSGVRDKTAYFVFADNGMYDIYLYDTRKKTGEFMSDKKPEKISLCIVSMPPESDFILMRRQKNKNAYNLAGEYYMYNIKTGEETYICESYTREHIISYMEEYYEWIDKNHLRITVYLEDSWSVYDVIYNKKTWTVSLFEEHKYN